MKKSKKKNGSIAFSVVFAAVMLLFYGYFSYLGLVYKMDGDLKIPAIIIAIGMVVCLLLIWVMSRAKASRWRKQGLIIQVVIGLPLLGIMLSAAFPFTNFVRVVEDSDDIMSKVSNTCDAAIGLDQAYCSYVDNRVHNYERALEVISIAARANPQQYRLCMGEAPGNNDSEKINNLSRSLRRRLLPDSTELIINNRHQWLESAKHTSIWNPLMSSNISKVDSVVTGWIDEYCTLSNVTYMGEEETPFEYPVFNSSLSELTTIYQTFQRPYVSALLLAIFCFLIMMLPYWLSEADIAGKKPKKGKESDELLFEKNNNDIGLRVT